MPRSLLWACRNAPGPLWTEVWNDWAAMEALDGSTPTVHRSILFAAGRGERLRPLTDQVAKPAVIVGDRPLGAYGLEALRGFGPTLVNLSHLADATRAALEPWAPPGTTFVVEAPQALGTAGTVAVALDSLDERFATWNSDVLTDLSIEEVRSTHDSLGAPGTVAVISVDAGGDFEPEGSGGRRGLVGRFIDRRAEREAGGLRFMGIAVFERRAVAELVTPGEIAGLGERVLRPLAERGELAYHLHEGRFLDVGTLEALETARRGDL